MNEQRGKQGAREEKRERERERISSNQPLSHSLCQSEQLPGCRCINLQSVSSLALSGQWLALPMVHGKREAKRERERDRESERVKENDTHTYIDSQRERERERERECTTHNSAVQEYN